MSPDVVLVEDRDVLMNSELWPSLSRQLQEKSRKDRQLRRSSQRTKGKFAKEDSYGDMDASPRKSKMVVSFVCLFVCFFFGLFWLFTVLVVSLVLLPLLLFLFLFDICDVVYRLWKQEAQADGNNRQNKGFTCFILLLQIP